MWGLCGVYVGSRNKTQHRETIYTKVFSETMLGLDLFSRKTIFFYIKLFLAILYKESISNVFQGLWYMDEEFFAKMC